MKRKPEKKYKEPRVPKRRRISDIVYLMTILTAFETIGIAMLVFPRSTESITEKRELKKFPELSAESWFSGEFTAGVSEWFSDTVPARDAVTDLSTQLRELRGFRQDGIRLHNVGTAQTSQPETSKPSTSSPEQTSAPDAQPSPDEAESGTYDSQQGSQTSKPQQTTSAPTEEEEPVINEDDAVTITNNGIAVVGTRALMLYGGSYSVGEQYAGVVNKYKEALGDGVNVYTMVIPTSCEFYSPESVKVYCGSQKDNIDYVYSLLKNATGVDAYSALKKHLREDIYLRTDHHWAPLGAYYAAQAFAETAGVPFSDISEYEQRVVHDYVGTMYGYTEDVVLKNNPEDFVYYVPKTVEYSTTYYDYILENGKIVGANAPYNADFFIKFGDGNGMAYCTFMGGDAKIVKVSTNAGTGRKLAIFKDSYGNALPPYLMGSFDEIIVIDMRYFTHNAVDFLKENGVTDVLFANNAFHAATASTITHYSNFLTQLDWGF